jgi:hypothetical protein
LLKLAVLEREYRTPIEGSALLSLLSDVPLPDARLVPWPASN